jgi:hypothetical protein
VWERGRSAPGFRTLGRLLQACGFEADFEFRRHDDVDRAEIRRLLAMTPAERLREFERKIAAAEALAATQAATAPTRREDIGS